MIARLLFAAFLMLSCNMHAVAGEPQVTVGISQVGGTFLVEATVDAQVALPTAWEVLTDFDHMTVILSNLTYSKVVSRDENTLIVKQEGIAQYGLLSFPYQSEREIRLEPMKRIQSKNLSGTANRMESSLTLGASGVGSGVEIRYRATIAPDSALARLFGERALRRQIEAQFQAMAVEMLKREADKTNVAALLPR
jgi:hypothetical protein